MAVGWRPCAFRSAGDSFSLHVDEMVGEQRGHTAVTRPDAEIQSATETSGTNLSDWIGLDNGTGQLFLGGFGRLAENKKARPRQNSAGAGLFCLWKNQDVAVSCASIS